MKNVYPFSKISMVPGSEIDNSPARCNRKTREVWLNADLWPSLSENTKDFVIYHEAGHIILQSTNEVAADEYAFNRMVKEGKSLKYCVLALTSLLTNSPGHRQRAYITLERAKAVEELARNLDSMQSSYSNFSIGSKVKKDARKANKVDKKENKIGRRYIKREKKSVKNEGKRSRYIRGEDRSQAILIKSEGNADSKTTLADMGITQGTETGNIIKSTAAIFAPPAPPAPPEAQPLQVAMAPTSQPNSMAATSGGGGGGEAMQNQFEPERENNERQVVKNVRQNNEDEAEREKFAPEPPKKKNNNMIFIIGGIVVVVIVAAVLIFKKSK